MNTLTIKDETSAGKLLNEIALQFEKEYITVEDLIAARIKEEVASYLSKTESKGHGRIHLGLVIPSNLEQRLNKRSAPKIDTEKQTYIALEAFKNNGFFILIDNEQVEELDQKFLVSESTNVSFIKLTPLVGG